LDQSDSCPPSCEARRRLPVQDNEVNHGLQSLHALPSMCVDYRKQHAAQTDIRFQPVHSMIRKGRLKCFGNVEHKRNTDVMKSSKIMKVEQINIETSEEEYSDITEVIKSSEPFQEDK